MFLDDHRLNEVNHVASSFAMSEPQSRCFLFAFQSVAQKSERIADEETKCQHMADLAQNDLNEALPALQEAMLVSLLDNTTLVFL